MLLALHVIVVFIFLLLGILFFKGVDCKMKLDT